MKFFLSICVVLSFTACANKGKFMGMGLPQGPKTGPYEYRLGWQNGCQTGITAYSSDYLKTVNTTKIDGKMMRDPYYNKGWELGQTYCSYYITTYLNNNNKELGLSDSRSSNHWFEVKSNDNFFSYKGWSSFYGSQSE